MAGWKKTINFKHFWNNAEMSIVEKGKAAATEIKRVFPKWEEMLELDEIIEMFEEDVEEVYKESGNLDAVEVFDAAMEMLYNYADRGRIWIATNF